MTFDRRLYPPSLRFFRLPAGKKGPPLVRKFWDVARPRDDFDPGAGNIGVATGLRLEAGQYLTVVDVDPLKGGFDSLETLQMTYGKLPRTYTVKTPSGGVHYYFASPRVVANSIGKLGPGIDVRGYHGYVVAAGSRLTGDNGHQGDYSVLVGADLAVKHWGSLAKH